jgi:hypothetical protein
LNFATLSKDLFSIFMLWSCSVLLCLLITSYTYVFSGFTSRPTSLLVSNRASVFFCMVSIFSPTMLTSVIS